MGVVTYIGPGSQSAPAEITLISGLSINVVSGVNYTLSDADCSALLAQQPSLWSAGDVHTQTLLPPSYPVPIPFASFALVYDATKTYMKGQVVSLSSGAGGSYVCLVDNTLNVAPASNPGTWTIIATGSNPAVGSAIGGSTASSLLGVDASGNLISGPPSASVALTSSPNTFSAQQAVIWSTSDRPLLRLVNTGTSDTGKVLSTSSNAGAIGCLMTTDWSANTTGQTGYDSMDILHRSSGDVYFADHRGGIVQAQLSTGTVAANNGILWVQYAGINGAAGNAVQIHLVASGNNTPLSVTAAASVVTVNLATDGSGNSTSTAAAVIAAVNALSANVFTKALPLADATGQSTGVGVVAPLALTNLSGGFTGVAHGCACFRGAIPYWLDDDGTGNGTIVNTRSGQNGFALTNLAADAYSYSMNLVHASRAPAIKISNANAAPYTTPVANTGAAVFIDDYSAVASLVIARNAAPAASSGNAIVSSFGAAISVRSVGAGTFPVLIAVPEVTTNAPRGLWLNNDGKASFGRSSSPDLGVVLVEGVAVGGTANMLQLANTDATSGAGAAINFYAGSNRHAQVYSQYVPSGRSSLFFSAGNSGALTTYAGINNAGFALALFNTGATSSDGILLLKNTTGAGQGPCLRVQVGSTPATLWDIDFNGNIKISGAAGLKIGTTTGDKVGFFNAAPVAQQATTGTATGFTAGAGTTVTDQSTFTGGSGSTAYRLSDLVLALKNLGFIAA